ncbi:MAG TPA: hypothetical protein VH137_01260 [Gemmatimonadales bacterium]|nr:hypothetical protein [Gemmatimonadales bacterium]
MPLVLALLLAGQTPRAAPAASPAPPPSVGRPACPAPRGLAFTDSPEAR